MRILLPLLKFALIAGVLIALGVWVLQDTAGRVVFDWRGWHVEAGFAFSVFTLMLLCMLLWKVGKLFFWLKYGSARRRERQLRQRQQDGLLLLTAGFNALASQDYRAAARAEAGARRKLGALPLVIWLGAQIASGKLDRKAAGEAFLQLARTPAAANLGWRGLMTQAAHGEGAMARLQPVLTAALSDKRIAKQAYLHEARLAAAARKHDWVAVGTALDDASRHHALPSDRLRQVEQAWLVARAQELLAIETVQKDKGRQEQARTWLERAHRIDPAFAPATLAYIDALLSAGDRVTAGKVIAASWLLQPSAALLKRFETAYENEPALARLQRFERIAAKRQDDPETQLALGQLSLAADLFGKAKTHIAHAQALRPSARGHRLLGDLALVTESDSSQAQANALWHARQGAAISESGHGFACQACGATYKKYYSLCDACSAFATIVPVTARSSI